MTYSAGTLSRRNMGCWRLVEKRKKECHLLSFREQCKERERERERFLSEQTHSYIIERLVMATSTPSSQTTLDPLQFAHRPNRSTDDAISIAPTARHHRGKCIRPSTSLGSSFLPSRTSIPGGVRGKP
jgi:hypothetical protein